MNIKKIWIKILFLVGSFSTDCLAADPIKATQQYNPQAVLASLSKYERKEALSVRDILILKKTGLQLRPLENITNPTLMSAIQIYKTVDKKSTQGLSTEHVAALVDAQALMLVTSDVVEDSSSFCKEMMAGGITSFSVIMTVISKWNSIKQIGYLGSDGYNMLRSSTTIGSHIPEISFAVQSDSRKAKLFNTLKVSCVCIGVSIAVGAAIGVWNYLQKNNTSPAAEIER